MTAFDGSVAARAGYDAGMMFERITVDPAQMGGAPCIRGLRIPAATVIAMVADRDDHG